MKRSVLSVGLFVALLPVSVAGQSTQPPARFQVADVHPTPPTQSPATPVMRVAGPQNGKYELRRATMVDLIRTAYGVEADKVVGGPHWLEMDRFDIIAKTPSPTTRDTVKPMLQALLVERFGLVARQEIKPVPGHALTKGAGELKLKEAPGGVATTCQQNIRSTTNNIQLTLACRGVSMASLAEQFTRSAANIGVTGPVVDGTGLAGTWDFDLAWTPAQLTASTGGPTFLDALKQLGLALEPKDVPMATITVATSVPKSRTEAKTKASETEIRIESLVTRIVNDPVRRVSAASTSHWLDGGCP